MGGIMMKKKFYAIAVLGMTFVCGAATAQTDQFKKILALIDNSNKQIEVLSHESTALAEGLAACSSGRDWYAWNEKALKFNLQLDKLMQEKEALTK
jgi:hypothetical protein